MKNAGRIQAAIEALDAILTEHRPADRVLDGYFKARRYIGSGDRAVIQRRVWGVLRRRARLEWGLKTHARGLGRDGRALMLVDLTLGDRLDLSRLAEIFDGARYAPAALVKAETEALRRLTGHPLDDPAMPDPGRFECPTAFWEPMRSVFGDGAIGPALRALGEEAPFDLRLNPLVATDRSAAIAALGQQDILAVPTPLSPLGLRLDRRRPVDRLDLFRSGAIEVQDEGSQIAALLVDARPGMTVVDYCAGAGGKALVLAGTMGNRGRLLLADTAEARLKRAAVRLRRAGVQNAERRVLGGGDKTVKRLAGKAQRVLVDAPCTGTGTWRRNPDAKWRYGAEDLAEIVALQRQILDTAARLVAPGGRLVYVTCSVLREENEAVVEDFLLNSAGFAPAPVAAVWAETVGAMGGGPCPSDAPFLRLTPHEHGTDGFFVAVLERRSVPAAV